MGFLIRQAWTYFLDYLNEEIVDLAVFVINFVNNYVLSFFELDTISLFLNFGTWLNILIFAVCFVIVATDVAEEKVSEKPVQYSVIFTNIVKAFCFALFARYLGQGSLEIANAITGFFGISLNADAMVLNVQEVIVSIITPGTDPPPLISVIFMLAIVIAIIYFTITSLRRFGEMFIHILTSALYIPDVMRGDTTKMGDWLRQMLSIALTYLFIYILFFLGCEFFTEDNLLISICLWLAMPSVSKLLNKYGWSSGTQGHFGSMAMQTGMLAVMR